MLSTVCHVTNLKHDARFPLSCPFLYAYWDQKLRNIYPKKLWLVVDFF
jgi:hypothetical protein